MENKLNTIKTPRGTFRLKYEFATNQEATEKGYSIYFTYREANVHIYTKHIDQYHCYFATVPLDHVTIN